MISGTQFFRRAFAPVAIRRPGAILGLALMLLPMALVPATARDFSAVERDGLKQQVARFDAAMRGSDYSVVAETIPPKVLGFIAGKAGLEVDQLKSIVVAQMQQVMQQAKLIEFGMDTDKTEFRQTADGFPYALVPSRTVMEVPGSGKTEINSFSLAIVDEGQWYLLRVDDAQQVAILREVYPALADVEFPRGAISAAE